MVHNRPNDRSSEDHNTPNDHNSEDHNKPNHRNSGDYSKANNRSSEDHKKPEECSSDRKANDSVVLVRNHSFVSEYQLGILNFDIKRCPGLLLLRFSDIIKCPKLTVVLL